MTGLEELSQEFSDEMGDLLKGADQALTRWLEQPHDEEAARALLQAIHTVKGSAGFLGKAELSEMCHEMEEAVAPFRRERRAPPAAVINAMREAISLAQNWLIVFKNPDERLPDLGPCLAHLRAVQPSSPLITSLNDHDPFSHPRGMERPSLLPGITPEPDMVNTLLGLLGREEFGERPAPRPTSQRPGPLGFSASPPPPRESSSSPTSPRMVEQAPPWSPDRNASEMDRNRRRGAVPRLQRPGGEPQNPIPFPGSTSETPPEPATPRTPPWPQVQPSTWPDPEPDLPLIGEMGTSRMRVDPERLDELLDLVGDLLQEKYRQSDVLARWEVSGVAPDLGEMQAWYRRISQRIEDLRDAVVRIRLKPVQGVFRKYPRLVEDLSRGLGREVELSILGEDAELDRSLLEGLYDPLTQLLRNAIDHGIEPAAERLQRGKPRRGSLTLAARREDNLMVIEVKDDGRGIDTARLAARAVSEGILTSERLQQMGEMERMELIFLPGISTSTEVTDTSGRGIGMDVVRSHLKRLGGRVELWSEPGLGTAVRLYIPLTLAIVRVLVAHVGSLAVGLPVSGVVDILRVGVETLQPHNHGWYLPWRTTLLEARPISQLLGLPTHQHVGPYHQIAVLQVADRRFAVWVDHFDGVVECVLKNPKREISAMPGVMGGTATATGELTLVLDLGRLQDELSRS